jgi:hypothetical protein
VVAFQLNHYNFIVAIIPKLIPKGSPGLKPAGTLDTAYSLSNKLTIFH